MHGEMVLKTVTNIAKDVLSMEDLVEHVCAYGIDLSFEEASVSL